MMKMIRIAFRTVVFITTVQFEGAVFIIAFVHCPFCLVTDNNAILLTWAFVIGLKQLQKACLYVVLLHHFMAAACLTRK